MRHEDRRELQGVVDLPIVLGEIVADQGVERAERFIHQHDLRARGEGAGERDALDLSAGKFFGKTRAVFFGFETHQFEEFIDACIDVRLRPAEQPRRDRDVLGHRHVREQSGALEHVAHAPAQPRRVQRQDVLAVDPDSPFGRLDQPVDHVEGGGLARAGFADQDEKFSVLGDEAQRAYNRNRACGVNL